jgi:aryl-alcohol dehydrogenase-like predicted oxidoreductase
VRHQLGVVPYYSLARGFLIGKYRSTADVGKSSARGPSAAKYLEGKGPKVLAALDEVASATAATPTQVALAWPLVVNVGRDRLKLRIIKTEQLAPPIRIP